MGVKWTKQQQQVIDLRDRNILVSAAAGSGKTAVLVERIITMLTDEEHPVNVDELLIVTFTEAAAGEMKERIRGAIEKALEENPENEHLIQNAITELTRGKTIITIAHRLSTIEQADQILVVADGQIAECGTHEELIRKEGKYQQFVKIREKAEGWKLS